MPIYEVRDTDGKTFRNDHNAYLCVAETPAAAKLVAQAETSVSPSLVNAVVTELDPDGPL